MELKRNREILHWGNCSEHPQSAVGRSSTRAVTGKMFRLQTLVFLLLAVTMAALSGSVYGATYYVDPSRGNDSAAGSASSPWRTIDKAKSSVNPGDTVNLMPGSYGSVTFSSGDRRGASGNYITYRNNPGSSPYAARFSRIFFSGNTNFYITVEGFEVHNNGSDDSCIKVENGSFVNIIDCKAHGNAGGSGPSYANIFTRAADNILIEDCEIYYTGGSAHAVQLESCDSITVRGCHVHDTISSGIRTGGGQNYVIEYNIIHDQRADWNPAVHGSGISIHSHDTVIRGNIVYNYGNTRPIRFYQSWAGPDGYRNMLVESNLVYRTPDFTGVMWWTEFIDVGPNCVFRNNTFIDDVTITFASNANGSGLSLYNNVVTGRFQLENHGNWSRVKEANNMFGQLGASGCGWVCFYNEFAPGSTSVVGGNFDVGSFFSSGAAHYPYSGEYPYELHPGSRAIDFADDNHAPATDLLQNSRLGRADAGCYEFGGSSDGGSTGGPPVADAGGDRTVVDFDDSGSEQVALDASGSRDAGGAIVSYVWTEGSTTIGTGVTATADLKLGTHTITLTVTDNDGQKDTDTITITVQDNKTVLKGFWKLGENAGSAAADFSDNSNTGMLVNDPKWTGYGGLAFDGVDDYVDCRNDPSLNVTGSVTVTACINPSSFGESGCGRILDKGVASTGLSLFIEEATQSLVYVIYGGQLARSNPAVISLDKWQHVAAVYNEIDDSISFYVDGQPAGTGSYATPPIDSSASPLTIGIRGSDSKRAYEGMISNVRLYSGALGQDEISKIFADDYPFAFYPIGDKEIGENQTLNFDIQTTSPDIDVVLQDSNLPGEPTVTDNVFNWQPTYDDAGEYEATFMATYGLIEDRETIAITVNNVNRAPVLQSIGDKTIDATGTLMFTLAAADPDGDGVTYAAQSLPAGATLADNAFAWTPAPNQVGGHEITFAASDGHLEDSETVTITVSGSGSVPNEGPLVGNWRFDESRGIVAGDSSPMSNDGALVNGPAWTTGNRGGALSFNGTNSYVDCTNASSLNLTGSLTVAAWINPAGFGQGGWGRIVDKGDGSAGFSFFLNQGDNALAYVVYGGNVVTSDPGVIALNEWKHVAVVYDESAGAVTFYVDGQVAGTADYTTPPAAASGQPLVIGIRGYDAQRAFDGLIDDVFVYNQALTAADVEQLYIGMEQAEETVIDNGDPATSSTGTWSVSSGSDPYGPDSFWSRDGSTYTWTFTPEVTADYTLSMRWSGWQSRSNSVPVVVNHEGGAEAVYVNQLENAGQWNVLGRYHFRADTSYDIAIVSQPAPSSTCADAVRFTP